MRILIVDENADFRLVLAEYLQEGLIYATRSAARRGVAPPGQLEIRHWDSVAGDFPVPGAKSGLDHDVILIDSNIAPDDPVRWLTALNGACQLVPPVVMLTSKRDPDDLAARIMPLGVVECVPRLQLTPTRLYESLATAVAEREQARTLERSLRHAGVAPTAANAPANIGAGREQSAVVDRADEPRPPGAASAITTAPDLPAAIAPQVTAAPAGNDHADLPVIPGYRLRKMIGEGGTARVYLAEREADGLQLVLKVLHPELAGQTDVVQRFMQEFSLIQKIQSVHVTRIFDLNYDRGMAYLAMEYFGAGDLRERLQAGFKPLPALKLFAQIVRALDAIHGAGVVHRDLKPHNIMFRDQHHLAIVDFGGAKALGEQEGITKFGQVVGTPNYMSPEQILGQPVDARTDLYSLGVILHQLLTGRTLYVARDTADLIDMHVNAAVPQLPPHLAGFQNLLSRLVAKRPEDRFESARDVYGHVVA